ncbi:hypothetical protein MRX96_058491 [Rhipicephalus microplus]
MGRLPIERACAFTCGPSKAAVMYRLGRGIGASLRNPDERASPELALPCIRFGRPRRAVDADSVSRTRRMALPSSPKSGRKLRFRATKEDSALAARVTH